MSQLLADCLNEIFEYLDDDRSTLHSCTVFLSISYVRYKIENLLLSRPNVTLEILSNGYSIFELEDCSSLITKLPNTLIKLRLSKTHVSLSFIAKFLNLQELELNTNLNDFEKLSCIMFSTIKNFKISFSRPNNELLIRFLKNNGKNLEELYIGNGLLYNNNSLNSVIFKLCTNLRKFSAGFKNDELEMLEFILKSCEYLKSIEIYCGGELLSEKEA
ncbi:hypothetical protein GLOIN_2v1573959 [Rhizophagus clarus]|uniref:F-box domain-containing protein n=1 Tax=Rhizophagus clarus TaxID=94130 RepID=A0A8H3QS82_9GLOM|nr:hypothetical protein GLOIN_2v1573959 [Rhizophagus clarus]